MSVAVFIIGADQYLERAGGGGCVDLYEHLSEQLPPTDTDASQGQSNLLSSGAPTTVMTEAVETTDEERGGALLGGVAP